MASLTRDHARARQSPRAGRGVGSALRISLFGVALSGFWTPLNTLVLPDLVSNVISGGARGSMLGLLTFVGIGLAALVQPIAGAFSDASRLPDRRRPFIVAGAVVAAVCCLPLAWLPAAGLLLGGYVLVQLGANVAQAAFQALVPDLVEDDEVSRASGIKTGLDVLGNAVGLAGAGVLVTAGAGNHVIVVFLAVLMALGAVAAWRLIPPVPPAEGGEAVPALARSAFAPLLRAPEGFRRAVLMRFVFLLGLYPVQRFLLYFLEDRFDVEDPMGPASVAILGAILLGAVGAAAAGVLAERAGRPPMLRASIVVSAAGLAGIALLPDLLLVGVAGAVLALGAGAFQAANWAELTDVIPEGQGARFFGVANIATAGASAAAGALGPAVDLANTWIPGATYQVTFGACALIALAALAVLRGAAGPAAVSPR